MQCTRIRDVITNTGKGPLTFLAPHNYGGCRFGGEWGHYDCVVRQALHVGPVEADGP